MLKTIAIVLALVATIAQAQVGLSSNATAKCASACDFSDPEIWTTGVVPGPDDTVTLQSLDTLNLVISTPVSIAKFVISDDKDKPQNIRIVAGGGITISGTSTLGRTATLQIDAGAYFIIGGQILVQGIVTVSGNMTCNGANPSIEINTKDGQLNLKQVFATVTLDNGYLIAPYVLISSTANLFGSGYVIGIEVDSTGEISPGTSTAVGTIYITGQLNLNTAINKGDSEINIKVASPTSFDRIIIGDTFFQDGNVIVKPLNGYEPLSRQRFIFANHTEQRGGFDSVRGSGFSGVFNNKWTVGVDQKYTFVIYDSASTVAISMVVIVICALLSL